MGNFTLLIIDHSNGPSTHMLILSSTVLETSRTMAPISGTLPRCRFIIIMKDQHLPPMKEIIIITIIPTTEGVATPTQDLGFRCRATIIRTVVAVRILQQISLWPHPLWLVGHTGKLHLHTMVDTGDITRALDRSNGGNPIIIIVTMEEALSLVNRTNKVRTVTMLWTEGRTEGRLPSQVMAATRVGNSSLLWRPCCMSADSRQQGKLTRGEIVLIHVACLSPSVVILLAPSSLQVALFCF